jgi:hypothetical protein
MKKALLFILLFAINSYSQNDLKKRIAEVVHEGKTLYKSEMASWYGTDLFFEKYKEHDKIGGYFSYSEGENAKCVFYSNEKNPKVIGTIVFDNTYNVEKAKTELSERTFSKNEKDLYEIRTSALHALTTDTIFKGYKNSSPNLIPIIINNQKKVYVLTGPTNNGVVIYGNDYLLTFNDNNELQSTKRLHANIIPVKFGNDDKNIQLSSIHSHLPQTGDLMTATDICTTMLYEKFTGWATVLVTSKEYVSIWNCKTDELTVLTSEAFDKMNEK